MARCDDTGVEQTCPYIDKVINFLDSLGTYDQPEGFYEDQKKMFDILEQIRSMNSDLRDFGNDKYKELVEMEKDKDYYERRCKELEKEIEYANDQIKELESELSQTLLTHQTK